MVCILETKIAAMALLFVTRELAKEEKRSCRATLFWGACQGRLAELGRSSANTSPSPLKLQPSKNLEISKGRHYETNS
jgi:hypothetical protein